MTELTIHTHSLGRVDRHGILRWIVARVGRADCRTETGATPATTGRVLRMLGPATKAASERAISFLQAEDGDR
jgi:hypothetical protein